MNKTNRKEKYNATIENNQMVLVLNSEILLPKDDDCFICAEGRKMHCRKVSKEVHKKAVDEAAKKKTGTPLF